MPDMESEFSQDAAPVAGLLRRLAALLYDAFLVCAIWMAIGFAMQFVVGPNTNHLVDGQVQTDPIIGAILFIAEVVSAASFYIWFWMRTGQTLGMLAWRIQVVSSNSSKVSLKQALLRWVLAWPSFFCLGVGYLWLYVDEHGNTIHDILSGTQVIVVPKGGRNF